MSVGCRTASIDEDNDVASSGVGRGRILGEAGSIMTQSGLDLVVQARQAVWE